MTLPDPDTTIGNYNGAVNSLFYDVAQFAADLSTLQVDYLTEVETVAGYVADLYADGIPSGAYAVSDCNVVSVLRAPLEPVVLVIDPSAVVASLAQALLPILSTLLPSNDPLVAVVTDYSQGEPLALANNPSQAPKGTHDDNHYPFPQT